MKNSLEWLNNTPDLAEERISILEDCSNEIKVRNRTKKWRKVNRVSENYGALSSESTYIITKVPEGKGRDKGMRKYLKKQWPKNTKIL